MKLGTARHLLAIVWVGGSVPVLMFVGIQSFYQSYGSGEQADKGWLWVMPILFPQLSTVLASSYLLRKSKNAESTTFSHSSFWTTFALSLSYLFILYTAIYVGVVVYRNNNWDFVLRIGSWILCTLQFVFFFAYSAFFNENE